MVTPELNSLAGSLPRLGSQSQQVAMPLSEQLETDTWGPALAACPLGSVLSAPPRCWVPTISSLEDNLLLIRESPSYPFSIISAARMLVLRCKPGHVTLRLNTHSLSFLQLTYKASGGLGPPRPPRPAPPHPAPVSVGYSQFLN